MVRFSTWQLVLVITFLKSAPILALSNQDHDGSLTAAWPKASNHARPLMREEVSQVQLLPNGMLSMSQGTESPGSESTTAEPDVQKAMGSIGSEIGAEVKAPDVNMTAAEAVGVKMNSRHDFHAFVGGTIVNSILASLFCLFFVVGLKYFPQIYMNNARSEDEDGLNTAPFAPETSLFGWISASMRCTSEEAEAASGLDAAMMIEFLNLAKRIVFLLAVPMVTILVPLHWNLGKAGRTDYLNIASMMNVEVGSDLCWVHAVAVWYVIVVVQVSVYRAQRHFLPRRFNWLKRLPQPTSTTVMVEGIPERYRSESALKEYFNDMFPGDAILSTYVAKNTGDIQEVMSRLQTATLAQEASTQVVQEAEDRGDADGTATAQDQQRESQQAVQVLQAEVEEKREETLEQARNIDRLLLWQLKTDPKSSQEALSANEQQKLSDTPYADSGFVTFREEREATLLLHMQCSENQNEFVMSAPPDPADVIYADLLRSPGAQSSLVAIGNACMMLLCLISVPAVTALAYFTQLGALKERFAFLKTVCESHHFIDHTLHGLLATLAMSIWCSFLPTILMAILYRFFPLKAHAWAQVKLQFWYYWMMCIFTILVTAVGNNPGLVIEGLVESPLSVFALLASNLPNATTFYMHWITMQWVGVGMDLSRNATLAKFLMLRRTYAQDVAIELAEPEDSDYYGLGGRGGRFCIQLTLALVFSTLTPMILVVSVLDFTFRRIVYGYLLVFAETRKADLGGVAWVLSLQQVQLSLMIYWILMIGVLSQRAGRAGPVLLAAPSALFGIYMYMQFSSTLRWEALPFHWVCTDKYLDPDAVGKSREASRESYFQDELRATNQLSNSRQSFKAGTRSSVDAERLASLSTMRLRRSILGSRASAASPTAAAVQAGRSSGQAGSSDAAA